MTAVGAGVLLVDKPGGMTSHDVVAEVSRRLGGLRAGHAGTLDPMATGVLVLCLGEATKIAGFLLAEDKAYDGELELGAETDTLDADGSIVAERRAEAAAVDRDALAAAIAGFVGAGEQVPPMYSAVRQGGRRLHELARAGIEVDRPPRPVHIHRFELVSFDRPRARFAVECSKGTFVRSLVGDLGTRLGCGAHLTALRRTRSGAFDLSRAVPLAEVTPDGLHGRLLSVTEALATLPSAVLTDALESAVRVGKPLSWQDLSTAEAPSGPVCLFAPDGRLAAVVEADHQAVGGRIRYHRVFPRPPPGSTNP